MIVLNGTGRIADVVALADRRDQVSVSPESSRPSRRAYDRAADLSTRFPTYGRTTGVGANRITPVPPDDPDYGMRLLRSHAVDAGDPLDDRTVRAMLAARLVQLCVPGAGLDPRILGGLERMLNDDALPELLQYASIGTGDLAALAGTALTLIGERPATAPLTPMEPWGADSALPFMSSSALTVGRSCLSLDELTRLERASSVIYMLSFLALDGNPSAFSAAAARAAAAPQVETRRRSTAVAVRRRRSARPQPGAHPGSVRAAGLPGCPRKRRRVAGFACRAAGADVEHGAGESAVRRRGRRGRPPRRLLPGVVVARTGRNHPGVGVDRTHHTFPDQNAQRPGYQRRATLFWPPARTGRPG